MFGMRHGNRNPTQFLKEVTGDWGLEGDMELTPFGKRQGYAFGRELREYLKGYLSANYMPSEAKFYSSSANRCQMTLQVTLAGLYPPRSFALWNLALDWSPVPYAIDDPMLRMYAVKCPKSDEAWAPITNDLLPELSAQLQRNNMLLEYMTKNTGWKPTLANAADLADNLLEISVYNTSYPAWIENVNLTGYNTSEQLINDYLKFMESHQIACANYEPCRKMMAGYWLYNILDTFETIMNTTKPVSKLIGFASHTEIVLSLMKEMMIDRHELTTTAGFILEVRDRPEWSVRILTHDPIGFDSHVINKAQYLPDLQKLAHKDGWIPLNEFIELVSPNAFKNWKRDYIRF
uniref:Uncharacterized protein n=1 Tax=Acrobeloides nanus TaxID=290746 RepID=A0A914CD73_9BILA